MTSPMTGFSHVQLLVSDVRASEQWYSTVLGMDRFAADESIGYVALRHKPSGVAIVLSTAASTDATRDESALDHLAFAVPTARRSKTWADHLTAAGIAHDGVVLELGKPSLQLRDPDGNAIELVAPPPCGRSACRARWSSVCRNARRAVFVAQ